MEASDNFMELFIQEGVQLIQCHANYVAYLNQVGSLYITEYLNSNKKRCIEWAPNDVTVDPSDSLESVDQEWAVVNTSKKRERSLSECQPPDTSAKSGRLMKIDLNIIHSFHLKNKMCNISFFDGSAELICSFHFQCGNCQYLVSALNGLLTIMQTKRDRSRYLVLNDKNPDVAQLSRSFAELHIEPHNNPWFYELLQNLHERPVATTLEAFSKVTNFVYQLPDNGSLSLEEQSEISRSVVQCQTEPIVMPDLENNLQLPPRVDCRRGQPLIKEEWLSMFDESGCITDADAIKHIIFRGGVEPLVRTDVWKYLLDYFPWSSTIEERALLAKEKEDEYHIMKWQWRHMTQTQEDNFSEYRERKSLIEKDVNRTDRTLKFYAGDNNRNVQKMYDILMTYVMYNFNLGYVQGMSDLLSPILHLMRQEVDAFWCFCGFMNRMKSNFDLDQAGMKEQLQNLYNLVSFVEPELAEYLKTHDSSNMYFCFRWLLVWFKRELDEEDVMRIWEIMWTGLPCQNFHLLICVAILGLEKDTFLDNNYGFTDILKHINELCGKLDIDQILNTAEGIYYQIKSCTHVPNLIRRIIGLPILRDTSERQSPLMVLDEQSTVNRALSKSGSDLEISTISSVNYNDVM